MSILAIDFGGTRTRTAWYDEQLNQKARAETPSLVDYGPDDVIRRIIDTARQVVPPNEPVRAIGISGPGPLNPRTGILYHAKTLPGWRDIPLAKILSESFGGAPARLENDANLAALAEYKQGAAQGCNPVIYLTISTGIGGGAIIDGKLFTGWSGLAIEPGHMRLRLADGQIERLEALASGTAIGYIARERLKVTNQSSVLRQKNVIDGKTVGEAAEAGDSFALEIIHEAGTWLGIGLVNLLHLFSPEAIVIGGSVSKLGDLLLDPARVVISQQILDQIFLPTNLIRTAQLGDDVCLVGAALHVRELC